MIFIKFVMSFGLSPINRLDVDIVKKLKKKENVVKWYIFEGMQWFE